MLTENCIICHKKAVAYSGHVKHCTTNKLILAGWCEQHKPKKTVFITPLGGGYFGAWQQAHGIRKPFKH